MADRKQLKVLQEGARVWNTWRKQQQKEMLIDLRGANLIGIDLIGADLSGVDLIGADLSGASLNGTHFYRTNLIGANFTRANLSRSDLKDADLSGANLNEANLIKADLSGANLSEANLVRADLSDANLSEADLNEVNLNSATLSNTIFINATIGLTVFGDLDLRTAKGLDTIHHTGPSYISTSTFERSRSEISETFLKGVGVSNLLIEYAHSLFNSPFEYYTCFISYSSKDEAFAMPLHQSLLQEGIRCWFAPENMNIGDDIRHHIDASIRIYDKLLLILSEHSITSDWVAYEVKQALKKESREMPNVLYPIRIDQAVLTCTTQWAKDISETRNIGDFEEWVDPQKYDASFKRLLRALNNKKEYAKPEDGQAALRLQQLIMQEQLES